MLPKIIFHSFDSKRRFGVEMEINRHLDRTTLTNAILTKSRQMAYSMEWGYTIGNVNWIVKTDSTCGDKGNKSVDGGGFEVVSPAFGGSQHLLNIGRVAKILSSIGAKVNDYCGLHCHVEIEDFDDIRAATLMAYWLMTEDVLSNMVPSRRVSEKGGAYCKLYTKSHEILKLKNVYDPIEFWNLLRPRKLDPSGKRQAMTFINYCRTKSRSPEWHYFNRNTVELRLPEGTLDYIDVMNWAKFFIHLVETSLLNEFPTKIEVCNLRQAMVIFGLSKSSDEEFYLLSPGFYSLKRWICERIIKFSRSVQLREEAQNILQEMTHKNISYSHPTLNEMAPPPKPRKRKRSSEIRLSELKAIQKDKSTSPSVKVANYYYDSY